jgi:DNA-binding transcriptional regulator YdaS (Cro superfamily)
MKLSTWIDKNGGTGKTGVLLGVKSNNVHAWLKGRALPRPENMKAIVSKSRGKVSLTEMVDEYLVKKAASKKKSPVKKPKAKKKAKNPGVAQAGRKLGKELAKKKVKRKGNAHNRALSALTKGKRPPLIKAKKAKKKSALGF